MFVIETQVSPLKNGKFYRSALRLVDFKEIGVHKISISRINI